MNRSFSTDEDILARGVRVLDVEIEGLAALREGLSDPSSALSKGFFAAFETIKSASGRVVVTGMGKSGHIARKIAATLASTGQLATFVHPAEASHGDLGMIADGDVVLALSNSGETPELGDIIGYCARFDIPLIGMTSGTKSALGAAADIVLPLPKVPEACSETRAPTTSTTMSLALGDALAVTLRENAGFTKDDFGTFHPGGKLGASLKKVRDIMHEGREVPVVNAASSMDAVISAMSAGGFGCVAVVDEGGRLAGIITDGDVRRYIEKDVLTLTANDVMTRRPKTVGPDTLAAEALGMLSKTRITALIVEHEDRPVGLLHVHDCLTTGVI